MKIINRESEVQELDMWNYPQDIKSPEMTCRQGDIDASYKDIVNVFGKETSDGDGYKVQAEWHIITPDGFATIYDYKQGKNYCGSDGIPKTKVRDWHIGGVDDKVVTWIKKALTSKYNK